MKIYSSVIPDTDAFDIVVIGAGGAGMAAALFAALENASVLIVEHTSVVGGTTALSAGTTWIPGTHHAASVNPSDTLEAAAQYLTNAIGERSSSVLRQAFLDRGSEAISILESKTDVKFRPYPKHPDYISDLAGSTLNGRALEPLPFDGRLLGEHFKLIRSPIPEFTVLGGMMVDRTDINHLLAMTKSWASFKHATKIVLRHALDRLRYPRGTRLVMGNALVARLLYSLSKRSNVSLALNTSVEKLSGLEVTLMQGKGGVAAISRTIKVNGGVILASGGFNRHAFLRGEMLGKVNPAWCPAALGHTGAAQDLARGLGAHYGSVQPSANATNAFWAPVSLRKRADGSTAAFPHFVMDRAKPGVLTVNSAGQRFVNESTSYHLFALAMQQANTVPAFLICDAAALTRFGLGMVRPGAKPASRALQPFLNDGYLTQATTLPELPQKLGIDAETLQSTVTRFNSFAASGVDLDFQRGTTAYQQNMGDVAWAGKNPNLGALTQAPFYAVRLYPGDIGASTGLATDTNARVLGADGLPIQGLYAVGNDMHSIMGGVYPAPGITIGPGIVFGYLAAKHATALN
jgi:succinate dehydrogenase/fumarate reductase flavoprotein subunit/RNase P/RNase MRP subunit p29